MREGEKAMPVENAAMFADAVMEEAFTVYKYGLPHVEPGTERFNAYLIETIEHAADRWKTLQNFADSLFLRLWCDARNIPYFRARQAVLITADRHIDAVGEMIVPYLASDDIAEYATMLLEIKRAHKSQVTPAL